MTEPARTERDQVVDALAERLAHIRARLDKAKLLAKLDAAARRQP